MLEARAYLPPLGVLVLSLSRTLSVERLVKALTQCLYAPLQDHDPFSPQVPLFASLNDLSSANASAPGLGSQVKRLYAQIEQASTQVEKLLVLLPLEEAEIRHLRFVMQVIDAVIQYSCGSVSFVLLPLFPGWLEHRAPLEQLEPIVLWWECCTENTNFDISLPPLEQRLLHRLIQELGPSKQPLASAPSIHGHPSNAPIKVGLPMPPGNASRPAWQLKLEQTESLQLLQVTVGVLPPTLPELDVFVQPLYSQEIPPYTAPLLSARRARLPILLVQDEAEAVLPPPEAAGLPRLVFQSRRDWEIPRALLRLVLRWRFFQHTAAARLALAELPFSPLVLPRPPTLHDLALWQLPLESSLMLLHPDPELPLVQRMLLKTQAPKLSIQTPTTLFRRRLAQAHEPHLFRSVLGRSQDQEVQPLKGVVVALAMSRASRPDEPSELTHAREQAIVLSLSRSLLTLGGGTAYCGDLRSQSWVRLLSEWLRTHSDNAGLIAQRLEWYPAPWESSRPTRGLPTYQVSTPIQTPPNGASLVSGPRQDLESACLLTQSRWQLTRGTTARVAVGGKLIPQQSASGAASAGGFIGQAPGLFEEAWMSLQSSQDTGPQPLYLVGGCGGAAGWLADFLLDDTLESPPVWREEEHRTSEQNTAYDKLCQALVERRLKEPTAELPTAAATLMSTFEKLRSTLRRSDAACLAFNGLTWLENQRLRLSFHPDEIAALILRGLLRWRDNKMSPACEAEPQLALQQGQLNRAEAEVLAVFVKPGLQAQQLAQLELGLSEAELCGTLDGKNALLAERLISLSQRRCGAQYLLVLPWDEDMLGATKPWERLFLTLKRLGATTVAVRWPSFAGEPERLLSDLRGVLQNGGVHVLRQLLIVESQPWVFKSLEQLWEPMDKSRFCVLEAQSRAVVEAPQPVWLNISLQHGHYHAYLIPPEGSAQVAPRKVPAASFSEILHAGASPLTHLDVTQRRSVLSALLGIGSSPELAALTSKPWVIVHDLESAALPFELLGFDVSGQPVYPACEAGGLSRLLLCASPERGFVQPVRGGGPQRLLLVVGDCNGLSEAEGELATLQRLFGMGMEEEAGAVSATKGGRVGGNGPLFPGWTVEQVGTLQRPATLELLTIALSSSWDILHFVGHAVFVPHTPAQSGLRLGGNELFSPQALAEVLGSSPSTSALMLPPVFVLNGCQTGRLRDAGTHPDTSSEARDVGGVLTSPSLAAALLQAGVQELIGPLHRVNDRAASCFAVEFYDALRRGLPLRHAVAKGRAALRRVSHPDWCSYVHYGRGYTPLGGLV